MEDRTRAYELRPVRFEEINPKSYSKIVEYAISSSRQGGKGIEREKRAENKDKAKERYAVVAGLMGGKAGVA